MRYSFIWGWKSTTQIIAFSANGPYKDFFFSIQIQQLPEIEVYGEMELNWGSSSLELVSFWCIKSKVSTLRMVHKVRSICIYTHSKNLWMYYFFSSMLTFNITKFFFQKNILNEIFEPGTMIFVHSIEEFCFLFMSAVLHFERNKLKLHQKTVSNKNKESILCSS